MNTNLSIFVLFSLIFCRSISAQICDPNGNLIIFSNYDGGVLNISIDQNIPNIKIGVVSYEACSVTIGGAFASNVSAVIYAGYSSNSSNCTTSIPTTSISGVSGALVQMLTAPAATMTDPNGNANIICAYDCDTIGAQGGCNTVMQIADFFIQAWPGSSLRFHQTQYGCWIPATTYLFSGQGNCCIQPFAAPVASMMATADSICVGECVTYYNTSSGAQMNPAQWSFVSGAPANAIGDTINVCYTTAGTFPVGITVSNPAGSDNQVYITGITVMPLPAMPTILQSDSLLRFNSFPNLIYQWYLNGNVIPGANNDTLLALSNGAYTVSATSGFGCARTSQVFDLTNLSLNDLELEKIKISPNPASTYFTIAGVVDQVSYSIFDVSGKLLSSGILKNENSKVDIANLQPGIYFVQVSHQSERRFNFRLVKN
jgi:PKD repeat protein